MDVAHEFDCEGLVRCGLAEVTGILLIAFGGKHRYGIKDPSLLEHHMHNLVAVWSQ
jgi:hypothetical protein